MPLFKKRTETDRLSQKVRDNAPISDLEFFALELTNWEASPERKEMLSGDKYYQGGHDILQRERTAIGNNGDLVTVDNLPNNLLVDNQYAKHVDQKKNYLLGQPISFEGENDDYIAQVKHVLGKKFMRTLKNTGCDTLNAGISWLYPYYNSMGELTFRAFPGFEILPFWADSAHTELDVALRLYSTEVYIGIEKQIVKKVDIFRLDGLYTYIFENGTLTPDPDSPKANYITVVDADGKVSGYNWDRIPLIPIKYNAKEIPLIRRVRSLQDSLNLLISDFANNMQEDVRNTILVLKNYDGTDLGEFRRNLTTYGVVKVRAIEGQAGGVDTLEITVNADNYKTVLDLLKKAIIENARSYDAKDDRMVGNPNQMNIQSMYADIDLDANDMETELQAAFEDILWFVNQHLANSGAGDYANEEVTVIFNRDILINETEAIDNCAKSVGIISNETIVGQHPWTLDPATELERIKAEKQEESQNDPYRAAFEAAQANKVIANEK